MYYYKLNISDWNLSTAHLEPIEELVYFRLINHYYDTEQPIPLETRSVIRRLRLVNHSDSVGLVLSEFFTQTEKGWVHSRCKKEIGEYKNFTKKQKLNGSKGGRPRKQRATEKPSGLSVGLPDETQNNPNQELLTTNHKPITKDITVRFIAPTLDEVRAHCLEKNYRLDPERFINFYESKGWMVGKTKMKKWKAALSNWEKKHREEHKRAPENTTRTRTLAQDLNDRDWAN